MAVFITCADSRIVPSSLTDTDAGELFIVRNAGNFVPPFGSFPSGEAASLEYAVKGLEISDIIVCGHTECGAIKYLVESKSGQFPHLDSWVKHAEEILGVLPKEKPDLQFACELNVILQLKHLLTYPFVEEAIKKGNLGIHGWLFNISDGELLQCDRETKKFSSLVSKN
jgi:carbonic anhydrase